MLADSVGDQGQDFHIEMYLLQEIILGNERFKMCHAMSWFGATMLQHDNMGYEQVLGDCG